MSSYDFEVGQNVIIYSNGWRRTELVSRIDSKTPSGLLRVNGLLFYPDGRQRGGNCWLTPATEEKIKEIKHKQYIQAVFAKLGDIKQMNYATALRLNEVLEEAEKTGGITKKSDENKAWEH